MNPHPFFLPAVDTATGQRFCLHHAADPAVATRGAMVYIHPFAEELNKSRRMAAVQSRAFARAGLHVLQIDLYGCGDSSGDFGDAGWELWRDDVALATRWLRERYPGQLYLWGLRLGALLALDCAPCLRPDGLLLWQPVVSGRTHLQQFARLQDAARLFGPAFADTDTGADRDDIAGYTIAPALADALRSQQASALPPPCPVHWLELAPPCPPAAPALQAASLELVECWRQGGASVAALALYDNAFWRSSEIAEAPALLAASLAAAATFAPAGAAA